MHAEDPKNPNSKVVTILSSGQMSQHSPNSRRTYGLMSKENTLVQISLIAIMTALVAVGTLTIRIPNPMGGYFNVGDAMVFVCALTFSPMIGGLAGGIGSAIADMIGFPVFVIPTLIIKGLEGFLASLITNRKNVFRDVHACISKNLLDTTLSK